MATNLLLVKTLTPDLSSPCQLSYRMGYFASYNTILGTFSQFSDHMRSKGHNSTSGHIFNLKFEIVMGCFLFDYEIW